MSSKTTLDNATRQQISHETAILLADTYILYVKSQNFHWNVVDVRFHSLHEFFEEQYKELAEAIDVIAERIRALGKPSPGQMQQFLELSRLEESPSHSVADEMLKTLLHDHESIIQWLRSAIELTTKMGDQGTADLYIDRLRAHEKTSWMIRSHFLGGQYESSRH